MSTDDRIDDSESETDTENSLEVTQPLRQRRRANMRQNIVSCNKSGKLSTAEYITPSEEHYQCEYCKVKISSRGNLRINLKRCKHNPIFAKGQ